MTGFGFGFRVGAARGTGTPAPTPAPAPGPTPAPGPVMTAPAYRETFDGQADGTRLAALPGWVVLGTNPPAGAVASVGVRGGRLANVNGWGDYGAPPSAVIGRAIGADHFIRARSGGSNGQTLLALAADAPDRFAALRTTTGGLAMIRMSAGGEVGIASTAGLQASSAFPDRRPPKAGSIVEARVVDGRLSMLVDGCKMRPEVEMAVPALAGGTHAGFSTFADSFSGWDDIEMGPLACDLTIDPPPRFVPRRVEAGTKGSAAVAIAGTVRGTMSGLIWRLREPQTLAPLNDWQAAPASVTDGRWTATVPVPAGLNGPGAYRIEVAAANDTQSAVTSNHMFAVGMAVLMYGQSNTSGQSGASRTAVARSPAAWSYHPIYNSSETPAAVAWDCATGWVSETDASIHVATAGRMIAEAAGVPVGFVNLGIPAHAVYALRPGTTEFAWATRHIAHAGGRFETILINQGEDEAFAPSGPTGTNYKAHWTETIAALRAQAGQPAGTEIPVLMAITGRFGGTPGPATPANASTLRRLQAELMAELGGRVSHHHVGVAMADEYHYTDTADGFPEMGRRTALSVLAGMGVSPLDGRGPLAGTPVRAGRTVTIPVIANGATSLSGDVLTSWQATVAGNPAAIESARLVDGAVVLVLAAEPGGPVSVVNHQGHAPDVSGWVTGHYADGSRIAMMPVVRAITTAN